MMKTRTVVALVGAAGLLLFCRSASAHHSDAEYESDQLVTLNATVTQFEFINPHQLIRLDAKDDKGNIEQWIAYGGAPNHMSRIGWTSHTLQPGERITITGLPSKYGRKIMLHVKIIRANGEELPASDTEQGYLKRALAKKSNKD